MSTYYLLIKDGALYKTTSLNYRRIAENSGYKYVGSAYGKNVSISGDIFLIEVTDNMRVSDRLAG